MTEWHDIKVNSKILGHISAGIYRTPGGALKELVSNAFDADATRVTITTNWPSFDIITCRDNGNGMTLDKFKSIMTQEIGNSTKKVPINELDTNCTNRGRPIIGWLGIGMLGVAQICHEFKLISHVKENQRAFRASIRLGDFRGEEIQEISKEQNSKQLVDVGKYMIEPIEYDPNKVGTYVIASDMRSAFVMKFRRTLGKKPLPLPSKLSEFLKVVHRARSVKSLSDYWQMVWELSVSCPIPYKDGGPFDWSKIEVDSELKTQFIELLQRLNDYNFEVVIDGLSLRKPNQFPLFSPLLPKKKQTKGKLFSLHKIVKVYGGTLKLSGYIYLQFSRSVEPMELRGLLIRIRNTAIGNYDSTFFQFPRVPSPPFNWLSGEIYVEGDLQLALNIDRDSFNELHPHYVALKNTIHELLEDKIFPTAGQEQRKQSQKINKDKQNEKRVVLESIIHKELGDDYTLTSSDEQQFPLSIDTNQNCIIMNDQSKFLPNSKNKRELLEYIAHAFEISMLVSEDERRETFYRLLSDFAKSGLL